MSEQNHFDLSPDRLPALFDGVSREVARYSADYRRLYQQGDVICREGDSADFMYVVLRGTVDISAGGESLVQRGPGAVVGEQAFIEEQPRGATITAVGQVEALRLGRAEVDRLLEDGAFARNLARALSAKLSEATRDRAVRYSRERLLFAEFGAHVSPDVAQRLAATGLDYGRPREVDAVILFSDIRDFTDTSAGLAPQDLASQLSLYFDQVVDVIHSYGGVVDKFIGDAVMAFWGGVSPLDQANLAQSAFDCAVAMHEVASASKLGGNPIRIGVGLNSGQVFMGNVGGPGKRQFTVLGTAVNLAARFESQSKGLGATVVLGERVTGALDAKSIARLVRHDEVPIKGAAPQTLYSWTALGD